MARRRKIKIEEILPSEYLTLSDEDKKIVCMATIKVMVETIAFTLGKEYTDPNMFKNILEVTIRQYEETENYEVCLILKDMLSMVDEL